MHTSAHQHSRSLLTPLLTALVLAIASCIAHALLPEATARTFAAVLLGALGGVYLGGALRGGSASDIVITTVAAIVCLVLATSGLVGPGWLIPAGFLFHGLWDWAHHALARRTVGRWWPPFCALYDLIVGVYLFVPFLR